MPVFHQLDYVLFIMPAVILGRRESNYVTFLILEQAITSTSSMLFRIANFHPCFSKEEESWGVFIWDENMRIEIIFSMVFHPLVDLITKIFLRLSIYMYF